MTPILDEELHGKRRLQVLQRVALHPHMKIGEAIHIVKQNMARQLAQTILDTQPFFQERSDNINGMPSGHHRSPREHLRRGHIRRLADGRRIWVNAAIVGAGKGVGVVSKDYALRHAA